MIDTPEESRKPLVFVVDHQPHDYTPANAFGTLVFIDTQRLAPVAPGFNGTWNSDITGLIRKKMADYTPGFDFIIPTGSPIKIMLVAMIANEKGKRHQILGWDARTQRYLQFNIGLSQ